MYVCMYVMMKKKQTMLIVLSRKRRRECASAVSVWAIGAAHVSVSSSLSISPVSVSSSSSISVCVSVSVSVCHVSHHVIYIRHLYPYITSSCHLYRHHVIYHVYHHVIYIRECVRMSRECVIIIIYIPRECASAVSVWAIGAAHGDLCAFFIIQSNVTPIFRPLWHA